MADQPYLSVAEEIMIRKSPNNMETYTAKSVDSTGGHLEILRLPPSEQNETRRPVTARLTNTCRQIRAMSGSPMLRKGASKVKPLLR
jgi:hypothetical protein